MTPGWYSASTDVGTGTGEAMPSGLVHAFDPLLGETACGAPMAGLQILDRVPFADAGSAAWAERCKDCTKAVGGF